MSVTDMITKLEHDAQLALLGGLVVIALVVFALVAYRGKTIGSILSGAVFAILLVWFGHNITSSKLQDPINNQLDDTKGVVQLDQQQHPEVL